MGPAAINIQMVRENLALAIAFWAAAQRGVITSASVPAKTAFKSITNDFLEVETPLELADNRELVRCVSNQIRSAFAFSAIQTYRSLEKTYRGSPLQEPDPNLRGARCSFYVLNKTVAQNLLSPVWVCPPDYRSKFEVRDVAFCLDAANSTGKRCSGTTSAACKTTWPSWNTAAFVWPKIRPYNQEKADIRKRKPRWRSFLRETGRFPLSPTCSPIYWNAARWETKRKSSPRASIRTTPVGATSGAKNPWPNAALACS